MNRRVVKPCEKCQNVNQPRHLGSGKQNAQNNRYPSCSSWWGSHRQGTCFSRGGKAGEAGVRHGKMHKRQVIGMVHVFTWRTGMRGKVSRPKHRGKKESHRQWQVITGTQEGKRHKNQNEQAGRKVQGHENKRITSGLSKTLKGKAGTGVQEELCMKKAKHHHHSKQNATTTICLLLNCSPVYVKE